VSFFISEVATHEKKYIGMNKSFLLHFLIKDVKQTFHMRDSFQVKFRTTVKVTGKAVPVLN
jgi:hypothetical protein